MPRGKKFNAAEKHFLKKEESYRNEIKQLNERLAKTIKLIEENDVLKQQVETLTAERDELLKLSGMSAEDMKKHLEQTKHAAAAFELMSAISRY